VGERKKVKGERRKKEQKTNVSRRDRREEEKDLLTGDFGLLFSVAPVGSSGPERE